jgi:predicted nucleic acid-binding Zn ribbon protein
MNRHVTSRSWTSAQIDELRELVNSGASPARAASRLNRTTTSVKIKAKILGFPFTDSRVLKRERRAKEASARQVLQ